MGLRHSKTKEITENSATGRFCMYKEDDNAKENSKNIDLEHLVDYLEKLQLENLQDPEKNDLKVKLRRIQSRTEEVLSRISEVPTPVDIEETTADNNEEEKEKQPEATSDLSDTTDLCKFQDKISSVVQSNMNSRDKIKQLQSIKEELKEITPKNESDESKISNIVDVCIVMETFDILRQVKNSIDHYKLDVPQFPFPKNTNMYKRKDAEVRSLNEHLCDLPLVSNKFIDLIIQSIRENVEKILHTLERKAVLNEKVLSALKHLDTIKENIADIASKEISELEKLKQFNDLRRDIKSVGTFNSKIIDRKSEIKSQLHAAEESCLSQFSDKEKELKSVINKCEEEAQRFCHSLDTEMYIHKRNEILSVLEEVKRTCSYSETTETLSETISISLEVLENTAKRNKHKNDVIEKIKSLGEAQSPKEEENLLEIKVEIEEEVGVDEWDDVVSLIEDLEVKTEVKNAKLLLLQLLQEVKNIKEEVTKLDRPLNSSTLIEKASNLLYVQDSVENMPEDNTELDNWRKEVLEEISGTLHTLVEYIPKSAGEKRQSTNILHLENQFKNLDSVDVDKNTAEFVQIIREAAEDFQESASSYLGATGSVDYYLIYENLVRLLEKLDSINSKNNEMLKSKVLETMVYIKNLLSQLDLNTY